MKTIYKMILSLIFLTSAVACDDYLDINDNPNQLVAVPSGDLLLRGTQLANAQIQQGQLARTSMYYTGGLIGLQLVQQTLYNYDYTPGDSNAVWGHIYNGVLVQNKEIRRISPDIGLLQGIVDVNEALTVGTATSLFGDIPYSTAVPDNPGVGSEDPTLDAQADVYAALQTLLDNAIPKIQDGSATPLLTDDDPEENVDNYFTGDRSKWIAAAYTLKARYYLQTKQYAQALANVVNGISDGVGTMSYNPIGSVPGNRNLLNNFVESSRAEDMTGDGAFYRDLLDPTNPNSRNNAKTNETARRIYSYISGDGGIAGAIDGADTPMKLVSYEENLLIWAECLIRVNDDAQGAIDKLNELRAYLRSGNAFNINGEPFLYDDYVLVDFEAGGMENMDNIDAERAVLREVIQERYVSGFSTYIPFNDARRLRASDSDLIVPFPLNNGTTTVNPQRFLYAQEEINNNSNIPSPIPDLFAPTPVNQ